MNDNGRRWDIDIVHSLAECEVEQRIDFGAIDLESQCINERIAVLLFGKTEYVRSIDNAVLLENRVVVNRGIAISNAFGDDTRLQQTQRYKV